MAQIPKSLHEYTSQCRAVAVAWIDRLSSTILNGAMLPVLPNCLFSDPPANWHRPDALSDVVIVKVVWEICAAERVVSFWVWSDEDSGEPLRTIIKPFVDDDLVLHIL